MNISHSFKTVGLLALSLTLAACSTAEKRQQIYQDSVVDRPLEMPPHLALPSDYSALEVPLVSEPSGEDEHVAEGESEPSSSVPATVVVGLTGLEGIRLGGEGSDRYLVFDDSPDVVWRKVEAYWSQFGPQVKQQWPELMIMDTEWAELDSGEKTSLFKKAFGALFTNATRDQFRVRLEAGAEVGSTELHLAHRRMQQQAVDESLRWLPASSDRELEIETLKRMLVFFGLPEAQVTVLTFKPEDAGFDLNREGNQFVLDINASPQWTWRRLRHAADRLGMLIRSSDQAQGRMDVTYQLVTVVEEGTFVSILKEVKRDIELRLVLSKHGDGQRLTVLDGEGGVLDRDTGEEILKDLLDKME